MTRDEVIDLLSLMASYDRRTAGETEIAAWLAAVGDLPFRDAWDAVIGHYRESTEWIMPAHVFRRVAAVRAERLRAVPDLEASIPAELADRPVEYARRLSEATAAVRDGKPAPKAIEGTL
jgi:hypothetical protein